MSERSRARLFGIINSTATKLAAFWDEVCAPGGRVCLRARPLRCPLCGGAWWVACILFPTPCRAWCAQVGFSDAERQAQEDELMDEVARLCEEKVANEESVRDTFVESINENKEKIRDYARRLSEPPPDLEKDEEGAQVGRDMRGCRCRQRSSPP